MTRKELYDLALRRAVRRITKQDPQEVSQAQKSQKGGGRGDADQAGK